MSADQAEGRYGLISSDSHVVEPPALWAEYVEARFRSRAPRIVSERETDRLVCDMVEMPGVGLIAGCGRKDSDVREEGRWDRDVMTAAYDPRARLHAMHQDGLEREVLFPTIGLHFYSIKDLDFQWGLFRAYNSWIADFVASAPDQFAAAAMIIPDDLDRAVQEIRRCSGLGISGILVPMVLAGDRPYHDPWFDPLWKAVTDHQMSVHMHANTSQDTSRAVVGVGGFAKPVYYSFAFQQTIVEAMMYGLFERFPALMIIAVEIEAGWAAQMLERADWVWRRYRTLSRVGLSTVPPSEVFRRHVRSNFTRGGRPALLARECIGLETLLWGTDFPHNASTWPASVANLDALVQDLPPEVRRAVSHTNAMKLYWSR